MPRQQTLSEWPKSSGSRESWLSGETPFTNRANEQAHGLSIASTKGKILSSVDTSPANPFDSIIVGYYKDVKLLYAAKVTNGFVPNTCREVAAKLKGLQMDTCPFANLPEPKRTQRALTREEMKNCVWVKPELVVQIEFGEWTPDGHLRHSRFVALREDKNPHEVIRES